MRRIIALLIAVVLTLVACEAVPTPLEKPENCSSPEQVRFGGGFATSGEIQAERWLEENQKVFIIDGRYYRETYILTFCER